MNRAVLVVGLLLFAGAAAAQDQPGVYLGGGAFVDLQRLSGDTSSGSTSRDATVAGGGVRVGAFLADRWSLELSVDGSAANSTSGSLSPDAVSSALVGLSNVQALLTILVDDRVRTQLTATSILVGYHPPPRGRLRAGFKGGMSFVRTSSTITTTVRFQPLDPRLSPFLTLPAPFTNTSSTVALSTAATVAAELGVSLTSHAAVVPEVRAFGFGGRISIRPGVELRWFF